MLYEVTKLSSECSRVWQISRTASAYPHDIPQVLYSTLQKNDPARRCEHYSHVYTRDVTCELCCILTGRKKTSFSHFCISVIHYPIGTTLATELPASQGSNFFSLFFFFFVFSHTCKNCYKMQTRTPIALKFGTQKESATANSSIKFGANPMNGSGVMTDYLHKTRPICCHTYRVNRFMDELKIAK